MAISDTRQLHLIGTAWYYLEIAKINNGKNMVFLTNPTAYLRWYSYVVNIDQIGIKHLIKRLLVIGNVKESSMHKTIREQQ